ncbi:hypothetical protein D3C80_2243600 [compost metagenome]
MNLVIDDQPPVPLIEQLHMLEAILLLITVCQDLIGRDRYGANFFSISRILSDLPFTKR